MNEDLLGKDLTFLQLQQTLNEDIDFAVREKPVTTTSVVTGAAPAGYGNQCISNLSILPSNIGSSPLLLAGLVAGERILVSDTRVVYESIIRKIKNIFVGATKYVVSPVVHDGTLDGNDVEYQEILGSVGANNRITSGGLPSGGNWRNFKVEFDTGDFSPIARGTTRDAILGWAALVQKLGLANQVFNKANVYAVLRQILQAGANVQITHDNDAQSLTFNSTASGGGGSLSSVNVLYGNSALLSSYDDESSSAVSAARAAFAREVSSNKNIFLETGGLISMTMPAITGWYYPFIAIPVSAGLINVRIYDENNEKDVWSNFAATKDGVNYRVYVKNENIQQGEAREWIIKNYS